MSEGGLSVSEKLAIGLGVSLTSALILVMVVKFNKLTKCCVNGNPEAMPRMKLTLNVKQSVKPVEKKTLLRTAYYTVEKNWDQVVVQFLDKGFFNNFKGLLAFRYKHLEWNKSNAKGGLARTSEGKTVGLKLYERQKKLILTEDGSVSWVMNDFQNICKNVQITDQPPDRAVPGRQCHLLPRCPTLFEETYKTDSFSVKMTQTEVDIKFFSVESYEQFKRAILFKYPTTPWTKYLQRDCAQIEVEGGKRVTLHLWSGVRAVWVSGDGRIDWYNNDFEELIFTATNDEYGTGTRFSQRSLSTITEASVKSFGSHKDIPTIYTITTLDTGGYEFEFPSNDYLIFLKMLLKHLYPNIKWKEYSCRHISQIQDDESKSNIDVHISTLSSKQKKIWIYADQCSDWINKKFREMYAVAYVHLSGSLEKGTSQPEGCDNTAIETRI